MRYLTEKQQELMQRQREVLELYEQGLTLREIKELVGYKSVSSVQYILKRFGVDKKKPKPHTE